MVVDVQLMNTRLHFSSRSWEWETPQWLFDALHRIHGFTLDVCATPENAKCDRYYTLERDGLKQPWGPNETIWMNPPYGRQIGRWVARAHAAAMHEGSRVVCLLPARVETAWFADYCMRHTILFIRGRLRFGRSENSAPFPSCIVSMYPSGFSLSSTSVEEIESSVVKPASVNGREKESMKSEINMSRGHSLGQEPPSGLPRSRR
jgi:site-specific DNA-methyltransferase (adenine-specific)